MKTTHTVDARIRAFSLIEVTIAMAIAAVAVITLLGMVPQGMNTMRDAGDEAIMGRIHQQVLNELQMADFDVLDTYSDMEFYFDGQGEELGDSDSGGSAKGSFEHIYSAKVTIPALSGGKLPDSVGGASFNGFTFDQNDTKNTQIRPAVIEVAPVGGLGANFDWGQESNRRLIRTYQTSVAKMGQAFGR